MDFTTQNAGDLSDNLQQGAEKARDAVTTGGEILREKSCEMLSTASEHIRRNPVPIVLGAFALGIAAGALIVSGKHSYFAEDEILAEPADLASHIGDSVKASLGQLYTTLKFW
ncbi:MAG: hypothetical protein V4584_02910 [Verrucomicrobiota bacterium]